MSGGEKKIAACKDIPSAVERAYCEELLVSFPKTGASKESPYQFELCDGSSQSFVNRGEMLAGMVRLMAEHGACPKRAPKQAGLDVIHYTGIEDYIRRNPNAVIVVANPSDTSLSTFVKATRAKYGDSKIAFVDFIHATEGLNPLTDGAADTTLSAPDGKIAVFVFSEGSYVPAENPENPADAETPPEPFRRHSPGNEAPRAPALERGSTPEQRQTAWLKEKTTGANLTGFLEKRLVAFGQNQNMVVGAKLGDDGVFDITINSKKREPIIDVEAYSRAILARVDEKDPVECAGGSYEWQDVPKAMQVSRDLELNGKYFADIPFAEYLKHVEKYRIHFVVPEGKEKITWEKQKQFAANMRQFFSRAPQLVEWREDPTIQATGSMSDIKEGLEKMRLAGAEIGFEMKTENFPIDPHTVVVPGSSGSYEILSIAVPKGGESAALKALFGLIRRNNVTTPWVAIAAAPANRDALRAAYERIKTSSDVRIMANTDLLMMDVRDPKLLRGKTIIYIGNGRVEHTK